MAVPVRDVPALVVELMARQIVFRSGWYRRHVQTAARQRGAIVRRSIGVATLRDALRDAGLREGALAMVHTSIQRLSFVAADGTPATAASPAATANLLLDLLSEAVGLTGTLAMPAHQLYRDDTPYHAPENVAKPVLRYDPRRTPCRVGLANELFWRRRGVLRSAHPLQAVAAAGPLATELVGDALGDDRPLPHGQRTAYYKIADARGLVVSVGTPLIDHLTLIHAPEDVRMERGEWPVPNFYRERRFILADPGGAGREVTVRERRPLFVRSYCEGQLRRDLLREGLVVEREIDGVRVDSANAGDVFDWMMQRNSGNAYPYFLPRLAAWGA